MRVIAPCPGERSAHAIRTSRCGMLERRVRKKVVTSTFTYDNNGNVTQKTVDGTTTTYVYDYANRLTALGVGGATTTYAYDWAGNRVSQTGTTTTYFYPFKWYSVASSTGSGAKYATTTDYIFNDDGRGRSCELLKHCDLFLRLPFDIEPLSSPRRIKPMRVSNRSVAGLSVRSFITSPAVASQKPNAPQMRA
jgi:RHS Repeat